MKVAALFGYIVVGSQILAPIHCYPRRSSQGKGAGSKGCVCVCFQPVSFVVRAILTENIYMFVFVTSFFLPDHGKRGRPSEDGVAMVHNYQASLQLIS